MTSPIEIDHNFSRAHRIVTTSILPVVEQYAEHSKSVWENSKFWKQFFEASANVSLSGYEEPPEQDETATGEDITATTPSTSAYDSPSQAQDDNEETTTPQTNNRQHYRNNADESILSTTPPEQSTPRPRSKDAQDPQAPSMAIYSSPYEALKREIKGPQQPGNENSTLPSTPRNDPFQSHDYSPSLPPSTARPHRTPKDDPLLHRILDKNWRLQATPHTTNRAPKPGTSNMNLPYRSGRTPSARRNHNDNNDIESPAAAAGKGKGKSKAPTTTTTTTTLMMDDRNNDDLDSSPAMPAPELHSEIFGTPARRKQVPGVSVLTPARNKKAGGGMTPGRKPLCTAEDGLGAYVKKDALWDDSDSDGEEGMMSPPKTMQFHVPQSKLLRTPG